MQKYSIQALLDLAQSKLSQCRLEGPAGAYRNRPDAEALADPSSCAAAVNIHYMLDQLPHDPGYRSEWIQTLQDFQDAETGLFAQGPGALRKTAACTAALHCFGQRAAYPVRELQDLLHIPHLISFLQQLDWNKDPEAAAREAAALYSILVLNRQANQEWRDAFTQWIHQETDPHTGLLRQGCIAPIEVDGQWTLLPYLCAILYPVALGNYGHQPLCMPWRLIDTALEVMEFHRELFFKRRGHRHLPWIFCLTRSMRQTAHRHEEVRQSLIRFVPDYLKYLELQIGEGHFQGPHQIQWDLSALAELQLALPGRLQSDHPLRQILDRHPFL
ncbi:MAG: hypothetical protein ACO3N7_04180 [Kiritimatiellia bacterium]